MRQNVLSLAAVVIGCVLVRPAAGQDKKMGLQFVIDDWSVNASHQDYGNNYGFGVRGIYGEKVLRGFWSLEMLIKHLGEGGIILLPLSAGVTVGPGGKGIRPYALAAAGCFGKVQAGIECSPVVGAGVDFRLLGRTYVEFWYYTRNNIRRSLTVGFSFET